MTGFLVIMSLYLFPLYSSVIILSFLLSPRFLGQYRCMHRVTTYRAMEGLPPHKVRSS